MKKLIILFFVFVCISLRVEPISYTNGEYISLGTIITDSSYAQIDYNILNVGDGCLSEYKRYFGIHNMTIDIPGYERVWLVKDDICRYPKLFTLVAKILPENFFVTQRWACIQSFLPLTLAFKIKDGVLVITASTFKYSVLAPFLTTETIPLKKSKDWTEEPCMHHAKFMVSVNGTTVVVGEERVVQLQNYSGSLAIVSVLPYMIKATVAAVISLIIYGGVISLTSATNAAMSIES